MDLELSSKRAIVTGGSRGIGKAVARALALEGVDVAIGARDEQPLAAAAAELSAESGRKILPIRLDTTDDASVQAMVKAAADALGGVDILVNCAARAGGQAPAPKFDQVTTEAFFEDINTKVMGYLRMVQQAAPYMKSEGWGRIINVSGMAARRTGTITGSMRNVAVMAMTKNLADELGPFGINVTCVHPAVTRTEATSDELAKSWKDNIIGRMVDSSEVADVVAFLASPKSVAITGDSLQAGGGEPRTIHY